MMVFVLPYDFNLIQRMSILKKLKVKQLRDLEKDKIVALYHQEARMSRYDQLVTS